MYDLHYSIDTHMASFSHHFNSVILVEKRGKSGRVGGQLGLRLSCSPCSSGKYRLLAKGCGFFVPKWVWLGISYVGVGRVSDL